VKLREVRLCCQIRCQPLHASYVRSIFEGSGTCDLRRAIQILNMIFWSEVLCDLTQCKVIQPIFNGPGNASTEAGSSDRIVHGDVSETQPIWQSTPTFFHTSGRISIIESVVRNQFSVRLHCGIGVGPIDAILGC
jgi:hypothetical protein